MGAVWKPDEGKALSIQINLRFFSHWILLGTKNINGIRYSSPWIANEQNGLNIAFGCTDS